MALARLADFRSAIERLLGETYEDGILDQGVSNALLDLSIYGPIYETQFAAIAAGAQHDLSGIVDIYGIVALFFPYDGGEPLWERKAAFREVGSFVVRLGDLFATEPEIGDKIGVRFRRLYKVDDLDSASTTTIPDRYRLAVAYAAGGHVASMRAIALALQRSAAPDSAATLRWRAEELRAQFMAAVSVEQMISDVYAPVPV